MADRHAYCTRRNLQEQPQRPCDGEFSPACARAFRFPWEGEALSRRVTVRLHPHGPGPGGGQGGGGRNSSGSTVGATPRARYPWPEQMARKMLRYVEKRGVHATLKVTKRCALDDRCHPTFRHFHAAIQGALGAMSTKHFRQLASLTAPILQQSDDANSLPRKA